MRKIILGAALGALYVLWLMVAVPENRDRTVNISDLHDDGCCWMTVPDEWDRTGI